MMSLDKEIESVKPAISKSQEGEPNERYRHFFFNNTDLACFASLEGYFEELNENFTKVLGYTTDDLRDKRFIDFIHPDDIESTLNEIASLSIGINTVNFVNRYRTKWDTYRYLEWNSTVNQTTNKIYGIARDVTDVILAEQNLALDKLDKERQAESLMETMKELAFQITEKEKRANELIIANTELDFQNEEKGKRETELLIANQRLEKAKNDIRKLNEELEQKVVERTAQLEFANKELEAFSYSVSHDLRAPLRALSGNATILKNDYADKFDEEGGKFLQSIIRNSKKMGVLIDDLLAFSKLGRKQVSVSEIDMNALLRPITVPFLADSEKGPEFEIGDLPRAAGDPSLIKQVWINLISNAVKYSRLKPKSIIKIGAYSDADFVTYFVNDNGAGFDMEYYDKLFGVFQRLHSQEEFEGTGIGLAIVQKIVNRHHGKVWAEATLGEGATFYFTLPAVKNQP